MPATKRQRLPIIAAQTFAPGGIVTVQLDALDALQAGQTMRGLARDRHSKIPAGTRDLFARVGAQLTSEALLAIQDGAK